MHQIVYLLELAQANNLERGLDQTALEELDGFCGIPAVTNVRTLDGDAFDDGVEHGCFEIRAGWETNGYDGSPRSNILLKLAASSENVGGFCTHLCSLLEWLLVYSD